jgi:hypothetical protein
MLLYLVLGGALAVFSCWFLYPRWRLQHLPAVAKPSFLFGNLQQIADEGAAVLLCCLSPRKGRLRCGCCSGMIRCFGAWSCRHQRICTYQHGRDVVILVSDVELVKEVLCGLPSFPGRPHIALPNHPPPNMFFLSGKQWKALRQVL